MRYGGSKADKAGGCMGEKQSMTSHNSGVALGTQKSVNFMGDGKVTAPKLDNSHQTDFRPGGHSSKV